MFTGAGVKTVVLFFEKGAPTKKVWFYQLNLNRNLGKTNPLVKRIWGRLHQVPEDQSGD